MKSAFAVRLLPVLLLVFTGIFQTNGLIAQSGRVSGSITDKVSGEPLIGASVSYAPGKGVAADLEGRFSLSLPYGEYELSVTYVGYVAETRKVIIGTESQEIKFLLSPTELREFEIVADLAKPRETPVAYSNVSAQVITERLGSQDLPMLLNSTPGVYATQQGGGDGDARVNIRGFSSQNVLVMIDGVPMNDMFNGRVFWTNWFGLDQMTQTMQVQRGLGASKLAIPAIGGTINIMTRGLDMERSISLKQEIGNDQNYRTVLSASTGRLKGDWNIQGAASFRSNEGWVDGLRSRMFFGYMKVNKQAGKHTLSLTAFGAPQVSGQRAFFYRYGVEEVDKDMAVGLGVDTTAAAIARGNRHYFGWNHFYRTRSSDSSWNAQYLNGEVSAEEQAGRIGNGREFMNTSDNAFFKPVISLRDFWAISDRFFLNNVVYFSSGQGGGLQPVDGNGSTISNSIGNTDENGRINLQRIYDENAFNPAFPFIYTDPLTGEKFRRSHRGYIRKNHNDHTWMGALSTFDYRMGKGLHLSGGLDARYYNGRVYSTVFDLMGGDLVTSSENRNRAANLVRREGDTLRQHIERDILWGGAFAMLEFKGEKLTAFINVSGAVNGYKQLNHFMDRQLVIDEEIYLLGFSDTVEVNGVEYTNSSAETRTNQTDWITRFGYTVKGGANYNLGKRHNVFANIGHFSRVPLFTFLVRPANTAVRDVTNELLSSFEVGYSFRSPIFTANLNGYYTLWNNKPTTVPFTVDGEPVLVNADNMGARHMGVELDFAFIPFKWMRIEGMASIGDWIWNTRARGEVVDILGEVVGEVEFDPSGVKVGDAAQHTYALNLRLIPHKRIYIMPEVNVFTHNFAQFNPETYQITNIAAGTGPNLGRQAWRMPDYYFINLHAGYHFHLKSTRVDVRANILNLTDNLFISDAVDNQISGASTFSAQHAHIWAGLGTRWMLSLTITL
jgi:iron complex outermembrane recepter protein